MPVPSTPVTPGPLVHAGPPLNQLQRQRYSRQLRLPGFGEEAQRRLCAARVLVVGAGGLGAPVIQYLAAAGVGTLGIVDDDVVEVSNLQRQVIHGHAWLGADKVASAAETVAALNPLVAVARHPVRLTAENALDLLHGYHLVVDGSDNFGTRYLVGDACEILGTPCVWGSILRFDGQLSVFWPGRGPVYRDLFPAAPDPDLVPSCAEAGVLGALCGSIGSAMAGEAIKLITGVGTPLVGRLLVHDALTAGWREIPLAPRPDRVPVTGLSAPGPEGSRDEPPSLSPAEFETLLAEGRVDLIDVREPEEARVDRLEGARLIPLADLLAGAETFDPQAVIVVHCASGQRSAQAVRHLLATGHPHVRDLAGGLTGLRRHQAAHTDQAAQTDQGACGSDLSRG